MKRYIVFAGLVFSTLIHAESNPTKDLQTAAQWGDLNGVKQAIKAGADINAKGELEDFQEYSFSKNALVWAAVMGHLDVVKYLVERGANIEARDDYGQTALFAAAKRGHADVVQYLLSKGAKAEVAVFGSNAVIYSLFHPEIVEMLAKAGGDVNRMSEFQQTPLMAAASTGNIESLRILLKYGAKVDLQFPDKQKGMTALMQAVDNGQLETAEALLQKGASLTLKDAEGRTALDIADSKGDEKMKALLKRYHKKK